MLIAQCNMLLRDLLPIALLALAPIASAEGSSVDLSEDAAWFRQAYYPGHFMKLLRDGKSLEAERLALIRSAKESIFVAGFAFCGVPETRRVFNALCEKARDGKDVRLLLEAYLSATCFEPFREEAAACGIRVVYNNYNPPGFDWLKGPYILHEKLLVVDAGKLIIGGSGYDDQYSYSARHGGVWHDLDVRVDGAVACWYQRGFIDSWASAVRRERNRRRFDDPELKGIDLVERPRALGKDGGCKTALHEKKGKSRVAPFYQNPRLQKSRPIQDAYIAAFKAARKRIRIYSPYFVPDKRVIRELLLAHRRGILVEIITNSRRSNDDRNIVIQSIYRNARELVDQRVSIRIWQETGTMHRKGMAVDDRWVAFGSENFDRRGADYSSEAIVFTDDAELIREFHAEFDLDLAETAPLTAELIDHEEGSMSSFRKWLVDWASDYI